MKKSLYFALVALLALPLMFSCKPKNVPEDPTDPEQQDTIKTPEEIEEEWQEGVDSLKVSVSPDAFIGIWRYAYESSKYKDSTDFNSSRWLEEGNLETPWMCDLYYEFKKDFSCVLYNIHKAEIGDPNVDGKVYVVDTAHLTWSIKDGKSLWLDHGYEIEGVQYIDKLTIEYVEENRFVVSEKRHDPQRPTMDHVVYSGYQRVNQLPELPSNPSDRLTKQAWKVVSDTLNIYDINPITLPDGSISSENILKEKKVNTLAVNGTFSVKEDGVFTITNANGDKIGLYEWELVAKDAISVFMKLTSVKNELELDDYISFKPDLLKENLATFTCTRTTFDGPTGLWYDYIFKVEAVK